MQFDLRKFLYSGQKPYHNAFEADLSGEDFPGFRVEQPACAVVDISTDGETLELDLAVQATISGECARCLEPVTQDLDFARSWTLRLRDLEDPDIELPVTPEGVLDLHRLVYQEVVMEAPFLLLCAEDCLGLCPVCGKKKVAGCTCQSAEDAAPANGLSILKTLLQ